VMGAGLTVLPAVQRMFGQTGDTGGNGKARAKRSAKPDVESSGAPDG
jgi:hypothetical protein